MIEQLPYPSVDLKLAKSQGCFESEQLWHFCGNVPFDIMLTLVFTPNLPLADGAVEKVRFSLNVTYEWPFLAPIFAEFGLINCSAFHFGFVLF